MSLQLLQLGKSVLSLDADAVLLSDVYALLHAPPLSLQDVIISDNAEEDEQTAAGLNCGFVYFNLRAPTSRRLASHDEAPICSSTDSSTVGDASTAASNAASQTGTRAATWFAEFLYDRFEEVLEIDPQSLRGRTPGKNILWEQDIWNDAVLSVQRGKLSSGWRRISSRSHTRTHIQFS